MVDYKWHPESAYLHSLMFFWNVEKHHTGMWRHGSQIDTQNDCFWYLIQANLQCHLNSWSFSVVTNSPCSYITFSCSVRDHRLHRCQAAELHVRFSGGFAYNKCGFALELLFIKNTDGFKMKSSSAAPDTDSHSACSTKLLPEVLQDKFPEDPGLTSSVADHCRWTWEWKPVDRKAEWSLC